VSLLRTVSRHSQSVKSLRIIDQNFLRQRRADFSAAGEGLDGLDIVGVVGVAVVGGSKIPPGSLLLVAPLSSVNSTFRFIIASDLDDYAISQPTWTWRGLGIEAPVYDI
jgi:hypothetical protein